MESILTYIRHILDPQYSIAEIKALTSIICCDMLGISTIDLYTDKYTNLSAEKQQKLKDILDRLMRHEPIQYICETTDFCGMPFRVTPDVLIPRPETEELVRLIAKENRGPLQILDIGTGSGCIAIALDRMLPDAKVYGWDISSAALAIARDNNHLLKGNVTFEQYDLFSVKAENDSRRYHIIVSNPPYVTENDKKAMQPEVLLYEPKQALFVTDADPLLYYRRIAELAKQLLIADKKIYFEINQQFGAQTVELLQSAGYQNIRLLKDFYQNDRMITANL
jgi:release factor glutamine methyltransferase